MSQQSNTRNSQAVYATATCERTGDRMSFRVGQPTTQAIADARWQRLDDRRGGYNGQKPRAIRIRHLRRTYSVDFFEVRSVTRNGIGLGSERHTYAATIPYVNVRTAL